jgi:nitrite reductase/ring-hydroxylating ferredoxin subunit
MSDQETGGLDVSRRTVLAAAGAVGAAGVLAACSSSGSSTGTASTAAASPSSAASSGSAAVLAQTTQVPVQSGLLVDDKMVIITQPKAGEYKAFSSVCPHQGCTVSEFEAETVTCPCHGSKFSSTTGEVLAGPATTGLTPVEVKVEGDQIVTA